MANLKSLAKDTAIYGLSSIIGRFLNYLLVPLYTAKMSAASGDYGIVTNVYAYTALLLAILTYGMETTFFRYANKLNEDPRRVYSTTLITVGTTSLLFVVLVWLNIGWIAPSMGMTYAAHPEYIVVMSTVVALDAFQAIIYAYLRYKRRPIKFASLKLLFIFVNIGLNLLYFITFPSLYKTHPDVAGIFYNPNVGVGYVFYLNLACTFLVMVCMWRELGEAQWVWDRKLLRRMFSYSWPILILSVAGIINQSASQIIFPWVYPGDATDTASQLGIYGAAIKVAMIMALITQAFRYAYEPFIFGKSRDEENTAESKETQAKAMKYFLIFTLMAYMAVLAGIDVLKYLIAPDYRVGLRVVPIVMAAEIMMGVYFNLSFWYKLTDKTLWGAIFSGLGCLMLILVNVLFVPYYGYMACAWAGVAAYGTAMTLSYLVGQRYYYVTYPVRDIIVYVALTTVLTAAALIVKVENEWLGTAYRTFLFLLLVGVVFKRERLMPMMADIPGVGKLFRSKRSQ